MWKSLSEKDAHYVHNRFDTRKMELMVEMAYNVFCRDSLLTLDATGWGEVLSSSKITK